MSKLDQLKALGVATRARKNTTKASGKARIREDNGEIRGPDKAPRSQSSLLLAKRGARVAAKPSKDAKVNSLGEVVSAGPSLHSPAIRTAAVKPLVIAAQETGKGEAEHSSRLPNSKRGRPKVEGKRPWELEGIPRRTWYRRQKEKIK